MEPAGNLYHAILKGTWKYAEILIASSVCMNGPALNIFAPWVNKYITSTGNKYYSSVGHHEHKNKNTTGQIKFRRSQEKK